MQGNKAGRTWAVLLGVAFMMFTLTGCGKNVLGPTAPTLTTAANASLSDAGDQVLDAECTKPGSFWNHGRLNSLIQRLVHVKHIHWLVEQLVNAFFTDPAVRETFWNIVSSKPFQLIAVDWGLGALLLQDSIRILAYSWYPGLGSTQNGFEPEVTLLPFAWSPAGGFDYPNYLSGWHNGVGYALTSVNPEGNTVTLSTYSQPGNIFQNQQNLDFFSWRYRRHPVSGPDDWLQFDLNTFGDRLTLDSTSQITQPPNFSISFEDVWASTADKSARCYLSDYLGTLLVRFEFAPDGSGGGFMEIPTKHGVVRYDLTHYANGHGYWTKDGGKPHKY